MLMSHRGDDPPREIRVLFVEVAELMSIMKQVAAQGLDADEVTGIHALTSANFLDAGRSSGRFWRRHTRKPSSNGGRLSRPPSLPTGGELDAAPRERWPDLSVCRDFGLGTMRAVLRRRLAPQCRVLLCIDEIPSHVRTMHRVILAGVDAVLVHSDALARAIHAFGVPASRIVLSSDRRELAIFDRPAPSRTGGDLQQIIHVGDLEPEAGVADFLLCVAAWAERNPQRRVGIRWCGEGCLRGVLEAQPLPPNVQQSFPGRIARKELAVMFLDCDILALPALADPWDDAVREALTAQLPVLGSTQSRAVVDLVIQSTNGWVFDPFESGAMARAVARALSASPDELEQMRVCAAARPKPMLPTLNERIWRAMRLKGAGPDFDPASLGLAL